MVNCPPLFNVVSLGGKEIVGVLKIMRDPYQNSSYSSLELYWIGWLLCETNHSLLSLIFLIHVIFVLDLLTPVHSLCTKVSLFYHQENLLPSSQFVSPI